MSGRALFILLAIPLMIHPVSIAQQSKMPSTALCAVCAVRENNARPEKVVAVREYEGKTYYFCSKDCAREFEAAPAAYLPSILPRPAPAFVVESLNGRSVSSEAYRGKVILLGFWSISCKPCQKTMLKLQPLHDEFSDHQFAVIWISIDRDADIKEKVNKFIYKNHLSYPVLLDTRAEPAATTYMVKAIPSLFLIDRGNNIVQEWRGKVTIDSVKTAATGLLLRYE